VREFRLCMTPPVGTSATRGEKCRDVNAIAPGVVRMSLNQLTVSKGAT
jgi:hypothetical protein